MLLLADEHIPFESITYLRCAGHDVISVSESSKSMSDKEIIALATTESRIILTFDRDYGTLIFKHGLCPPEGVIYLRLGEVMPDIPGRAVHDLLSRPNFFSAFQLTTFNGTIMRQRSYKPEDLL